MSAGPVMRNRYAILVIGGAVLGCHRPASVDDVPAKPLSSAARAASSAAPEALEAGAARPTPTDAAAPAPDPCLVTDRAELLDLNRCYVDTPPAAKWDVTGAVEVTVTPAEVKTTPGGIGDLVVHYANKTSSTVVLVFDDSPARGHVVAHRPDGRRADGVETPPPAAWATSARRFHRITLAPKAAVDEKKMWFASSWKWQTKPMQKEWPRALLGPLPKGTYALRVRTPLITRFDGDHVDYAEGTTSARLE